MQLHRLISAAHSLNRSRPWKSRKALKEILKRQSISCSRWCTSMNGVVRRIWVAAASMPVRPCRCECLPRRGLRLCMAARARSSPGGADYLVCFDEGEPLSKLLVHAPANTFYKKVCLFVNFNLLFFFVILGFVRSGRGPYFDSGRGNDAPNRVPC
jgi:hypothetical protein